MTTPLRNGDPKSHQRGPPSPLGEGQIRDVERLKQFPPILQIEEWKIA